MTEVEAFEAAKEDFWIGLDEDDGDDLVTFGDKAFEWGWKAAREYWQRELCAWCSE